MVGEPEQHVFGVWEETRAAIEEHRQELALSEVLRDVIGSAVANRKIGECYAELGNIEAALKQRHLDLARSVGDAAEEQRALATIGRTFLFRYESDQSQESLRQAENAFKKSLAIVDERLEGAVPARELSEMRARLFLNLGFVCDGLKEPQRCSDFIRRSIFIAERNHLVEDLYRANFNLGSIHFRNGQHSRAVRCLEQAKECARKMKDKFAESECYSSIGQVLLSLGDFVAARRSLKKAFILGSQQAADREVVKRALKHAIRGCQLEQAVAELGEGHLQEAVGLAEQLGDLYCKVGCYSKALEAYNSQLSSAVTLGKPARELAVIHVSLAATYTDLRLYHKAVEHYREELALREGNSKEECESWLNVAACMEDGGKSAEEVDGCYTSALRCAETAGLLALQRRVLKAWLSAQRRLGSTQCDVTEARLQELGAVQGGDGGESDVEEENQEENSEPLEDSDIPLSDSDEDLEEYEKLVPGRRKTARWNKRNEKGETCLHRACIEGNVKQVQYLLEQGHPLNPRDYCGWTPLHEACNHGHHEIVALLLDRGANINDPGGPLCEGVTPLHDALSCGHFQVARLLVERGASVTLRNSKGEMPLDCLRSWLRMYNRELDQETQQESAQTERLLKKAASCTGKGWSHDCFAALPATKPFDSLQDSQLFDAENSEPLVSTGERCSLDRGLQQNKSTMMKSVLSSPSQRRPVGRGHRQRGTEEAVLFGDSSSSDQSDSDDPISPLRPVRPRLRFPQPPSPPAPVPTQDPCATAFHQAAPPPVCGSEDYQRTIRSLGSAKSRLLTQDLSEPEFTSTPAVSANSRSALVPEDEYLEDDWLEDDLGEVQPKKRRRVSVEHDRRREKSSASSVRIFLLLPSVGSSVPTGGRSLEKGSQKSRQVKMTQLSGMVLLGRREVGCSQSPAEEEPPSSAVQGPTASASTAIPAPIRMRVRVQDNVFLIPVPHSEADSCTVSWLCEQAAQRYYQACGLLPRLSLQKEGALLSPHDLLLAVLQTNEEVLAEVTSWDLPPLPERYRKACQSLSVAENRLVSRLCEAQDGSPSVSVCGLSLPPAGLRSLLRALKLQPGLTELRLSGNRLRDDLMPELISAVSTMPRLRLLDVSANCITGEGLKKAAAKLEDLGQSAFPCLEELDLSANPLGDSLSQPLSSLLSCCPLLSSLSLQACGLSGRFLQQHRLLLASALSATGHLRSVCLSHNPLGSTGLELVLKSLPLQCLTHLYLSAVLSRPGDPLGHLILLQEDCSVTHLSFAANGLTDNVCVHVCLHAFVCVHTFLGFDPIRSLTSLDLSGNPGVTTAGLGSLVAALQETRRPLTLLNLQGCAVGGPWDGVDMDSLSCSVRDLRLCSQRLNKLDQRTVLQSWRGREATVLSRSAKCFVRVSSLP
uniref:Tonsoku-like protein n=1 Tax=Scleropages formosus TaxID=113540 RepID=A0A8C9QSR1_SCLFO